MCNASPVIPNRDPICEVLCTSRVTWVDSYRGDVHAWHRPATVGGSRCVGSRRRATKGSLARVQASRASGRRRVIPRLAHVHTLHRDMRPHQKLRWTPGLALGIQYSGPFSRMPGCRMRLSHNSDSKLIARLYLCTAT